MRKLLIYTVCLLLAFMPMTSCVGPMDSAQGNAIITEIRKQVDAGGISPELGGLLVKEIETRMDPSYSGGIDWEAILKAGGGILAAALFSYTGVRITRGPAKPMDKSQADMLAEMLRKYQHAQAVEVLTREDPEEEANA